MEKFLTVIRTFGTERFDAIMAARRFVEQTGEKCHRHDASNFLFDLVSKGIVKENGHTLDGMTGYKLA